MPKNVLSIQSHVACGHVGNAVAVFALQRLGIEVWPVHTVRYAYHPGHGAVHGRRTEAAEIAELVAGLDALGALARCDAVLTGYVADGGAGREAASAAALVKRRNPAAVYCCDPVMGDTDRGYFVAEDVRSHFSGGGTAGADVLFPNAFELAALSGNSVDSPAAALAACDVMGAKNGAVIVATGVPDGTDAIATLVVEKDGAWSVTVPRIALARRSDGAGDLFAALWLGHRLHGASRKIALARAASATHGILRATFEAGATELALIAAQDEIVAPSRSFDARRLR